MFITACHGDLAVVTLPKMTNTGTKFLVVYSHKGLILSLVMCTIWINFSSASFVFTLGSNMKEQFLSWSLRLIKENRLWWSLSWLLRHWFRTFYFCSYTVKQSRWHDLAACKFRGKEDSSHRRDTTIFRLKADGTRSGMDAKCSHWDGQVIV